MGRSRIKLKGRRENGSFIQLPHAILESSEYAVLSAHAVKALIDLFAQFRGENNGDFTAAWSVMRKRGWKSKAMLYRALNELIDKGWIIKTRQGGRYLCSLYAVTWKPINTCKGKLDILPTRIAPGTWKNRNTGPYMGHISPTVVPIRRDGNAN